MGVKAFLLHKPKRLDKSNYCTKEAKQGSQLSNCRKQVQLFFEPGHFSQAGFLQSFANALATVIPVQNSGFNQARDRAGGGVANGQGFNDVFPLQNGSDAVQELGGIDLSAMTVKKALNKNDYGDRAAEQNDPQHQPAVSQQCRQRRHASHYLNLKLKQTAKYEKGRGFKI